MSFIGNFWCAVRTLLQVHFTKMACFLKCICYFSNFLFNQEHMSSGSEKSCPRLLPFCVVCTMHGTDGCAATLGRTITGDVRARPVPQPPCDLRECKLARFGLRCLSSANDTRATGRLTATHTHGPAGRSDTAFRRRRRRHLLNFSFAIAPGRPVRLSASVVCTHSCTRSCPCPTRSPPAISRRKRSTMCCACWHTW
jgi:hypothetical protein